MRESTLITALGIANRARIHAPWGIFNPKGRCVVCGQPFRDCSHSKLDNEWALAVVRFNRARI